MCGPPGQDRAKIVMLYNKKDFNEQTFTAQGFKDEDTESEKTNFAVRKETVQDQGTHLFRSEYIGRSALVLHNNSDAFWRNIKHEPSGGSLDGARGDVCNAFLALEPDVNRELLARVYTIGRENQGQKP